jgi:hypothetical protein
VSQEADARRAWKEGPEGSGGGAAGWLALSDDDLLFRIEALGPQHDADAVLMEVVRSERHFFIRQEAAKRIRNADLLKEHLTDRHIGQILVRVMNRAEDVAYLERLVVESRHIEVRKAAEAQLRRVLDAASEKHSR